mmetsp:Transcript_2716/g.8239  ORF Transcript_2716/g.8239 Transcript_2716/m.8239 type:complete len:276 (-) Transcript_2716:1111-1938(-)
MGKARIVEDAVHVNQTIRCLYKSLLRNARYMDKHPAAKALFVRKPWLIYDDERQGWAPMFNLSEKGRQTAADYMRRNYTEKLFKEGDFYKPEVSIEKCVREAFRSPVRASDGQAMRIDAGFDALKDFSKVVELAEKAELKPSEKKTKKRPKTWCTPVSADQLKRGVLLASHPLMLNTFGRKLILIHDYEASRGCAGLIINSGPLAQVMAKDLFKLSDGEVREKQRDVPCFFGGPVLYNGRSVSGKGWLSPNFAQRAFLRPQINAHVGQNPSAHFR